MLDFYLMQLDTLQTTYKNLLKTDYLVCVLNFLSYLKNLLTCSKAFY